VNLLNLSSGQLMKKEAAGFSIIKTLGTTTKIHDITHNGMHMADSLK
jgi:hypothetical protein